jgi:ankyrin repeat protein
MVNSKDIETQSLVEFKCWVESHLIQTPENNTPDVVQKIMRTLLYDLDDTPNDVLIEEKIQFLIQSGVQVNVETIDFHPLSLAIAEQNTSIARLLLNAGATINYRDDEGSTPLTTAVISENIELLRLLLTFSTIADVNTFGSYFVKPPIGIAFVFKRFDMIKLLLAHGADPFLLDWDSGNIPMFENLPQDCEPDARQAILDLIQNFKN